MTEDISLAVALGAGVLSFLSPCVLSLVPVYLASLYGGDIDPAARRRMPMLWHSVTFVAGFSLVFVALGALAGLTGHAIRLNFGLLSQVAGGLLIAFGVLMLASLKVPWLNYEKRLSLPVGRSGGYPRSFLIGAAFSLGWTACVGPILAGILALASARATVWQGASLLLVYSAGLGLPFVLMGVAFDSLMPWLKRIRRFATLVRVISGLLLIGVGILVLTNNLLRVFSVAG